MTKEKACIIDEKNVDIIRGRLQDELSERVFDARMDILFNRLYNDALIQMNRVVEKFGFILSTDGKILTSPEYKRVIVFGAGFRGRLNSTILGKGGVQVIAFADNNSSLQGKFIEGIPIIEPKRIKEEFSNIPIVVSNEFSSYEIRDQLLSMGIEENRIVVAPKMRAENRDQYFDVLLPADNEVFVDAGCYRGETSARFREWCNDTYKRIIAFEPDYKSFGMCKKRFKDARWRDIVIENKGLSDKEARLWFDGSGTAESHVSEIDNGVYIDAVSLDDYLNGTWVSLIKMDIEGAEYDAINGMYNIIKKYRPRLAISVYHKMADFIMLPSLILSIVPDYRFWLRHYTASFNDTVLYAEI